MNYGQRVLFSSEAISDAPLIRKAQHELEGIQSRQKPSYEFEDLSLETFVKGLQCDNSSEDNFILCRESGPRSTIKCSVYHACSEGC